MDTRNQLAIIGLGCRLPSGVTDPDGFWRLLSTSSDGIGPIPGDRWRDYAAAGPGLGRLVGRTTQHGGFLADIAGFDAEFFGLTPREAELMDPQQRILLEVAVEALEHAGVPVRGLAGRDVGVFMGIGNDDYGRRLLEDLGTIEAWTGIGASYCAAANRISYALDLRGPSMSIDTACSSSLVALHLARQSLLRGESELALVGGVNLIVSPGLTVSLDAAGATAPDGRCKPFDAAADGYGRGEGCGVLVLKRLADAQRDGDRVLAVVLGSAVQQDGRTNGIMAPSGPAQEHLLRQALDAAGVDPSTVDYVEAHGTGTPTGDPVEAGALARVYGAGRAAEPCLLGSVKANVGHLEAAAGVVGIIKTVMALGRGEIPPSLRFDGPSSAIDWDSSGLRLVDRTTPWPVHDDRPRRAGVSGFGYGGTIAHVVLEQPPVPSLPPSVPVVQPTLFPLSAATSTGLRQNARRLADWLSCQGDATVLADVGHTLATRRSHLNERATVLAASHTSLVSELERVAAGDNSPAVSTGSVIPSAEKGAVWVFSGHGAQWAGMGRELLVFEPVFAAVIDELARPFAEEIGYTPREVIEDGDFSEVDRAQTMTYALQVALAALWESYGLRPAAVIGHSVGEIAAAVVTGVLGRDTGARLVCRRSVLLRRVAGQGAMAMVSLPFGELADRLAGRDDVVAAIAAAPASTVVSGDSGSVAELSAELLAEGVLVRPIATDVAFHSRHMDPLIEELVAAAKDLTPRKPTISLYSTALEDPRGDDERDGRYWARNLRAPVRFAAAVDAALADGHRVFLEVSAHPLVSHSIIESLHAADIDGAVLHTLRRNKPQFATLLANLGGLHCAGVPFDWATLQPPAGLASLPTQAWRHRPYWRATQQASCGEHDPDSHTLLGPRSTIDGPAPTELWQTTLTEDNRPYPGSHTINGVEVVPAAVLVQTLLDASGHALTDLAFRSPLVVGAPLELQVTRATDGLRIASRLAADRPWQLHVGAASQHAPDLRTMTGRRRPSGWGERLPDRAVQDHLASVGVPTMAFPWAVTELERGGGVLSARVDCPPESRQTWATVLDAAFSVTPLVFGGTPELVMVAGADLVRVTGTPPSTCVIEVRTHDSAAGHRADVLVTDDAGLVLAELTGLRYAAMGDPAQADPAELTYRTEWCPVTAARTRPVHRAALCGGSSSLRDALGAVLARAGIRCEVVSDDDDLERFTASDAVLLLPSPTSADMPAAEAARRHVLRLATVAQRLAHRATGSAPRLWCVTEGVREGEESRALAQSGLWGLGRIIAGEHPDLWGGLIDLPTNPAPEDLAVVHDVLKTDSGEDLVTIRESAILGPRLSPLPVEPDRNPIGCRPDATYLVTGGLGVLGLATAGWLVDRGARRLVLLGRHTPGSRSDWDTAADPEARQRIDAIRALEAKGATITTVALDIADTSGLRAALSPDALGMPAIRGVVHAAGVLDNRMLADLDEQSLNTVLRPKVDGALALHDVFPPGTVDFFVLFSSCGQQLRLAGQASYAAANSFLDALAAHRRALGCAGSTSIAWTSWRGMGMAVNTIVDLELAARGVGAVSPEEAFAAWDHASAREVSQVTVLRRTALDPGRSRLPILRDLPEVMEASQTPAETGFNWEVPPEELRDRLFEEVTQGVSAAMRIPADELDARRNLTELGLDSVLAIIVLKNLERRLRLTLPSTLLWHRATISAVVDYLTSQTPDAELVPVG